MQVTEIKFTMGLTVNTGDYSNVRPELTATAVLDENDDHEQSIMELSQSVISHLHQIADSELQEHGQPPRYAKPETLYIAGADHKHKAIALYPAFAAAWVHAQSSFLTSLRYGSSEIRTLAHAREQFDHLTRVYTEYESFDFLDGDDDDFASYIQAMKNKLEAEEEERERQRIAANRATSTDKDEYDDEDDDEDEYDDEENDDEFAF